MFDSSKEAFFIFIMSNKSTTSATLEQIEERIDALKEFIQNNGSVYAAAFAYPQDDDEDTPAEIRFDPQSFTELQNLYKAANRILYRQLLSLKALRTELNFETKADLFLEELRAKITEEIENDNNTEN